MQRFEAENALASSPALLSFVVTIASFADLSQFLQKADSNKFAWRRVLGALGALSRDSLEPKPVNVLPVECETKQPWSNISDLKGLQNLHNTRPVLHPKLLIFHWAGYTSSTS